MRAWCKADVKVGGKEGYNEGGADTYICMDVRNDGSAHEEEMERKGEIRFE